MAKITLDRSLLKSSAVLFSLLLLISVAMSPAYANSNSRRDKMDKAKDTVTRHMEMMKQKCPGIDEKKMQIEEKLRNGTMFPHEACSHCHIKGRGSKPTGR